MNSDMVYPKKYDYYPLVYLFVYNFLSTFEEQFPLIGMADVVN